MKAFWEFLHSQPSAASSSVFFWLRCLLLLVGAYAFYCCALSVVKKKGFGVLWSKRQQTITNITGMAGKASLVILGVFIGAGWSNYQFYANRYHYDKVVIVGKLGPSDYSIQPARMQPFKAHTCTPMTWEVGQHLKYLDLNFTPACDDVAARGAYEFEEENSTKEIAHE